MSVPREVISSSTSRILTKARAIIQSSDPIVLDNHFLDINRNVITIDVIVNKVAAVTISAADRFGCGRSQVPAWTFATTTPLEIYGIKTPKTYRVGHALYNFPADMPMSTLGEFCFCIGKLYPPTNNWPMALLIVDKRAADISQRSTWYRIGATNPTRCDVCDRPLLSTNSG